MRGIGRLAAGARFLGFDAMLWHARHPRKWVATFGGAVTQPESKSRVDARRHAAYRATTFRVDDPAGAFDIRIDRVCPALDALLDRTGAQCWAYVTAHNPGGRLRDASENAAGERRLEAHVCGAGLTAIPGRGIGAGDDWPPEASLLILDISRADAIALARGFDQEAIVAGVRGQPAELVFCSIG